MPDNTIQFYAQVEDESLLEQTSFYRFDIEILKKIAEQYGYELKIGTSPDDLVSGADMYYAWWATTGISPLVRSKLSRSPSIIVAGGSEIVSSIPENLPVTYSARPFWERMVIRTCLTLSDITITPSAHMAEEARNLGSSDPRVIPNCIDTSVYTPGEPKEGHLPDKNRDFLLSIAKYAPSSVQRKQLFSLVESVKKLDIDAPLVLAGGLISKDIYEKVVGHAEQMSVSDQIFFLTDISEEQKLSLLRAARLYLQPTLHEGFGVAITEAMACETPVVSSKRGAVPEVVGDTGYYAEPKDPVALAETIESAWDDDNKNAKAVEARQRVIDKFSLSVREQKLEKIITHLLYS